MLGLAVHEQVVGLLHAVPALVAVHGEVAADHATRRARPRTRRRRGTSRRPLGDVSRPSVKACTIAPSRGQLDQRLQVAVGRVHAAVAHEPDQVHARRVLAAPRAAPRSRPACRPATALSMRARSCGTIAPAPRLRCPTSELPIWPSGSPTLGPMAVSVVCGFDVPQLVEHRRLRERHGVARTVGGEPPAVQDDERDVRDGHAARAASTIAANDAASSEAPPTSAPSMSG